MVMVGKEMDLLIVRLKERISLQSSSGACVPVGIDLRWFTEVVWAQKQLDHHQLFWFNQISPKPIVLKIQQ